MFSCLTNTLKHTPIYSHQDQSQAWRTGSRSPGTPSHSSSVHCPSSIISVFLTTSPPTTTFQAELDNTIVAHDTLKDSHGTLQAQMYETTTQIIPKLENTEEKLRWEALLFLLRIFFKKIQIIIPA